MMYNVRSNVIYRDVILSACLYDYSSSYLLSSNLYIDLSRLCYLDDFK